jgi:hypothetical protein
VGGQWLYGTALWAAAVAATLTGVNIQTIVERSVAATKSDWDAAPQYSYRETDRGHDGSKTYRVCTIDGSPYRRLIAVNDGPLSAGEQRNEEEKLSQAKAKRKSESKEERAKRIEAYNKERQRDHAMLLELTRAFDFKSLGQTTLNGHSVYAIRATPRKDFQPSSAETKVLTGMRGELWIDKETFQWVKVTARVIHPVSIEGFLARVDPGTYFELEKEPAGENVWLPSHFAMRSKAAILGIFQRASREDDTFSDYRKEVPGQADACGPE